MTSYNTNTGLRVRVVESTRASQHLQASQPDVGRAVFVRMGRVAARLANEGVPRLPVCFFRVTTLDLHPLMVYQVHHDNCKQISKTTSYSGSTGRTASLLQFRHSESSPTSGKVCVSHAGRKDVQILRQKRMDSCELGKTGNAEKGGTGHLQVVCSENAKNPPNWQELYELEGREVHFQPWLHHGSECWTSLYDEQVHLRAPFGNGKTLKTLPSSQRDCSPQERHKDGQSFGEFGVVVKAALRRPEIRRAFNREYKEADCGTPNDYCRKTELDDAEVNAQNVNSLNLFFFRHFNGDVQKPFTLAENQVSLTARIAEQDSLLLTTNKRHLSATLDRPDTYRGRNQIQGQDAGIVSDAAVLAKRALNFLVQLVAVRNLRIEQAHNLSRQRKLIAYLPVKNLVERKPSKLFSVPRQLRQAIAGGIRYLQRLAQGTRLFGTWQQFNLDSQFHCGQYTSNI